MRENRTPGSARGRPGNRASYLNYDPVTGRWPSRDPVGELGGDNVYAFLRNSGLSFLDLLGLSPIQDHHPIPHNKNPANPDWNFQQHPLVRCADVDLENDLPMVKLENHAGGHSPEYKNEVKRRLDAMWEKLKRENGNKCNKCDARKALYRLNNRLIANIESGHVEPYNHKPVKAKGRIPPRRKTSPFHPQNIGRAGGIMALIGLAIQADQASAQVSGQMRELENALWEGNRNKAIAIAREIALILPDPMGTINQTELLLKLEEAIDDYFSERHE